MLGLGIYLLWLALCMYLAHWAQKKYGTYDSEIPYDPNQLERVQENLQRILWVFLAAIWSGFLVYVVAR